MRHERVEEQRHEAVEVGALWPVGLAILAPLDEIEAIASRATPAVPDLPKAAGTAMLGAYGGLMGAFVLTLASGGEATFMIAISIFYVAMYLGVPILFLRTERPGGRRPTLTQFLESGMETATGHISGVGALTQMLIVPLLLTLAVLAIGTAALIIL